MPLNRPHVEASRIAYASNDDMDMAIGLLQGKGASDNSLTELANHGYEPQMFKSIINECDFSSNADKTPDESLFAFSKCLLAHAQLGTFLYLRFSEGDPCLLVKGEHGICVEHYPQFESVKLGREFDVYRELYLISSKWQPHKVLSLHEFARELLIHTSRYDLSFDVPSCMHLFHALMNDECAIDIHAHDVFIPAIDAHSGSLTGAFRVLLPDTDIKRLVSRSQSVGAMARAVPDNRAIFHDIDSLCAELFARSASNTGNLLVIDDPGIVKLRLDELGDSDDGW